MTDQSLHTDQPVRYGPNSPFDPQERKTIERIYHRVKELGRGDPGETGDSEAGKHAGDLLLAMKRQMVCLEWLGEVLSEYPSPTADQTLGNRHRGLDTLVDSLCRTTPANFDFHVPTRALLGRALVMAETNFYRLCRYICLDVLTDDDGKRLREEASHRLRICLYTKLAEEALSAIATDETLDRLVRSKAVSALAQIWDRQLTYRVSDFFPLLEATWEARQRVTVTGGTLNGTQEIFELFKAGCDPEFVDFFTRPDPSDDEIEAFREFLFGTSTEELDRLAAQMASTGVLSISLQSPDHASVSDGQASEGGSCGPDSQPRDPGTIFYEFFQSRHLLALGRRLANLPGPKQTAEGYVLIYFLSKTG